MADALVPLGAARRLTDTRLVITGALWNGLGRALPLLVAVWATPRLIAVLGIDRWGVFTLALTLVGIFGVFDLGVGRALTRGVAERLGAGDTQAAAAVGWTGLVLITALGAAGGIALALMVDWVIRDGLTMPTELQPQAARALYLLCLAVPLAVINAGLWGILAASQQFRTANLVNMPVQCAYYLGPLAVLPVWNDLSAVIAILVLARLVMTVAYALLCRRALPALRRARFDRGSIPALLRQGGWMTLSNLTQPLLLYLDRFVVATLLSVAATAYYATPYDMLIRAWVIPVAIMNAVYPAFAAGYRAQPVAAQRLYHRSNLAILGLLVPPCLAIMLWGDAGLRLWLGADFATHASGVLRWLAIGLLFNCIAFVPAGLLDGIGRANVNAICAVLQAVLYVPVLLITVKLFGVEGAAIAWSLRVAVDCIARLLLAAGFYPPLRATLAMNLALPAFAAAMLLALRLGF